MKLRISENDLTLRDLRDFRKETGRSPQAFFAGIQKAQKDAKEAGEDPDLVDIDETAFAVLLWIARRKDDPAYTIDDALDIPFSELAEIDFGIVGDDGEDGDPTNAGSAS